jgi:CubicO group peptidase (beta-lactamase class C family)
MNNLNIPGKSLVTAGVALALALATSNPACGQDGAVAPAPTYSQAVTSIDSLMARRFRTDKPGATIIVVKDGRTVFRKAYGLADIEHDVAMRPEMSLRIGSMTKQFTAAAIMLLAERRRLSLGDDIGKYLPAYANQQPAITIENLLTHTSGIANFTSMADFKTIARNEMTPPQMINFIRRTPPASRPGEHWEYSNSGYYLLGLIIEQVSGMKYAAFLEKNIFEPLQMKHTFYDNNQRLQSSRVNGYTLGRHGVENADFISLSIPFAAGALRSSVDDLALWNSAMAQGVLLRPESWARMTTAYTLANGRSSGYGYGFFLKRVAGQNAIEHGGDIDGFSADAIGIPAAGLYVAILTNCDVQDPDVQTLAEQIVSALLP